MKALQITLFIIANIIFITEGGRDVHELIWGSETSVLDQFSPDKIKAMSLKTDELLKEYQSLNEQIRTIEKQKGLRDAQDSQENQELYQKRDVFRSEISERESKAHEFRDTWIFTAYGFALIVLGIVLYRRGVVWSGFSIVIAGFAIFEYWVCPSFFGGATAEFHALLVSKTILTVVALVCLYVVWRIVRPDCQRLTTDSKA